MSNRERTAEMLPTWSLGAWPVTTPSETPASSGTMPVKATSPGSPSERSMPASRSRIAARPSPVRSAAVAAPLVVRNASG